MYKYLSLAAAVLISYLFGFVQDFIVTPENAQIKGFVIISDGDTIKVNGSKIRLYGIDAPELKQKCYSNKVKINCGIEAKAKIAEIISDNEVFCSELDTDKYNRTDGNCYFIDKAGKKINIGQKMVTSGYALAYKTYSMRFVLNELYAKITMSGIWMYQFKKPWLWRKTNK
jgi:endonuclease YncB( thermonuclease family)